MRKIIKLPNNTGICDKCGCYFSYEDEDVTEFDERKSGNGDSLFWFVACPSCGEELVVVPDSCVDKAEKRRLEILSVGQ